MISTQRVSESLGVSLRQLQWWDEHGIVGNVQQNGHARGWSEYNLLRAAVTAALRKRGISLQRVRKILQRLERRGMMDKLLHGAPYLLVDPNDHCYIETDADRAMSIIVTTGRRFIVARINVRMEDLLQ